MHITFKPLVQKMATANLQDSDEMRREQYRKFLRFPLLLQAKCYYNVEEKAESCRVVDISNQGMGLELDIPVRMQNGQLILLEIEIDKQKTPVNAITKLAWVQKQEEGFMMQRLGSFLLFMDPQGKEQLMEQAYSGLLTNISRWDSGFSN